jgi:hypothetical protein
MDSAGPKQDPGNLHVVRIMPTLSVDYVMSIKKALLNVMALCARYEQFGAAIG